MKRSLSILLVMMLLCMMIPTGVLAGGGLGLYVSGIEVTGTTADVLGDGTVAFDADTSTLTLKSAKLLAGATDHKAIVVADSSSLTKLTIALSGSNTISLNPNGGEADLGGIIVNKGIDVKFTGSGSLDITDKGTGKMGMITDPTKMPAAFFMFTMGSGSLTIGEEDGSAPDINITCNRIAPFMAMCNSMTNYGTLNISVPTADGFSQPFGTSQLANYGTIKVSCDAYREDLGGTVLMTANGSNEGTIELTASTAGGSDEMSMAVGLMSDTPFTNSGSLKVKIGGDTTIEASTMGVYTGFSSFTNTGFCEVELNNIAAMTTTGIQARDIENTGTIDVNLTDVGRNQNNDDQNQISGITSLGTIDNYIGSININIGDSIAPRVVGLEAVTGSNNDITNTGMINVKIGNAPNGEVRGIHTEGDFCNSGSASSVDITIGKSTTTALSPLSVFGLSVAVQSGKQVLTNEGTINVNVLDVMPGMAVVVTDQLINKATGRLNVHAKEYGVYLATGSLENNGTIYTYGSTNGTGLYANKTVTNEGLLYATGGLRALLTEANGIEGSGSADQNANTDNLELIEYNSSSHQYLLKDTDTVIKTFYSVTSLMAYKQDAVKVLEQTLLTEGYVSENARQAMEYWRDEILNATTTGEVDGAKDSGLQEMADAEADYLQAKEEAKQELEDALSKAVSDDAKQILQDAIDSLDTLLNTAVFSDLIPTILQEAEEADKALKDAQEAAIAELEDLGKTTYTSDEALAAMEDAIEAIKKATNLDDVAAALEAGKQAMADAGTLKGAQNAAINELEEAKKTAVSDEAKAALEDAIQKVKEATTVDEVTAAKEAGLKAAEEADKALRDAQDAAIAELEAAKSKAVSDEAKTALDEAIQKVKEATNPDAVTAAKEAGLKAAVEADKALKDAIAAALAELDEAKVTASEEARAQIDAAKTKIAAATSVGQVEKLLAELYDAIFEFRYVLLEGNGLEWVKGSDVTAKFRSSAPYEKFVSVEIDGSTVPASEYTSENGSTIIWLKSSMLGKLGVGKHKIVVRSKDGLAKGYFYVKPALPPTGDSADPFLWTVLLTMSLGLAVTAIRMKRKEQ